MNQTRTISAIEVACNYISGFIIAYLTWSFVVVPIWDVQSSMIDNFTITMIFTVVSVVRSYFWRRFFNGRF